MTVFHSVLRPNYRRYGALAREIEAARRTLEASVSDPTITHGQLDDLRDEIAHLERELSLTGVTSEYDA